MVKFRDYNEEKGLDRVWYTSSNIAYSECDDNKDDLKTLRVTFNNGATYQYEKVNVNDYVMFVNGGTDGSNGKALNKLIKPKYDWVFVGNLDVSALNKEMEELFKAKIAKETKEIGLETDNTDADDADENI